MKLVLDWNIKQVNETFEKILWLDRLQITEFQTNWKFKPVCLVVNINKYSSCVCSRICNGLVGLKVVSLPTGEPSNLHHLQLLFDVDEILTVEVEILLLL